MIQIPFKDEFREALASGRKTATSRFRKYGNPGDLFEGLEMTFELTNVDRVPLGNVAESFYSAEGLSSPDDFRHVWAGIHPKRTDPSLLVYLHQFKRVK